MSEGIINVTDIKRLVNGYNYISNSMKKKLLNFIQEETKGLKESFRAKTLRNMYNIFAITGRFNSQEIFTNGRITFRDDNEMIFDMIAGSHFKYSEKMLFTGCSIGRGNGSSYIIMNNIGTSEDFSRESRTFNFRKIVEDAITPPEISIILNAGYYPTLMENILFTIK